MKHECCVCHRELESSFETIHLTPADKQAVEQAGLRPAPDLLMYCKPCWKILSDHERGAQFMRGLGELSLRRQGGVVDAEARATKFHTDLLAKVKHE